MFYQQVRAFDRPLGHILIELCFSHHDESRQWGRSVIIRLMFATLPVCDNITSGSGLGSNGRYVLSKQTDTHACRFPQEQRSRSL